MKLSATQKKLIKQLQASWFVVEGEVGYVLAHETFGCPMKIRSSTIQKLLDYGLLEYSDPNDEDDKYLKLTPAGRALKLN